MKRQRGFTLLEVLVALAIFATVAGSVLTASSRSLRNAGQLEAKALAGWIADNHITELQLLKPTPGEGREDKDVDFAGRKWEVHHEIESTSDKTLRRVTVWVAQRPEYGRGAPVKDRSVMSLTGFMAVRK